MIAYLKNKPLVGLALAIASGYVIAHVITKTGDYLFDNNPELLETLVLGALALGCVSLAVKKRHTIGRWVIAHIMGVTVVFSLLIFPYLAGVLTVAYGNPNGAGHACWVTFLRLGLFFFLAKVIAQVRDGRRRDTQP